MADKCNWRLRGKVLEVCFHSVPKGGMETGIPGLANVNDDERPNKRRKLDVWRDVTGLVLWFDQNLLLSELKANESPNDNHSGVGLSLLEDGRPSPSPDWVHALRAIGKSAGQRLEFCIFLALRGRCFPVPAVTALLEGTPNLQKLEFRALSLRGTPEECAGLGRVFRTNCARLDELYYEDEEWPLRSLSQLQAKQQLATTLVLAQPKKRLTLRTIPSWSTSEETTLPALCQCPDLEYLEVQVNWWLLPTIAQVVKNAPRLDHLCLGIWSRSTVHVRSTYSVKEAFRRWTTALRASRIFFLDLQMESSMLCNTRIQELLLDLFRYNYTCRRLTIQIHQYGGLYPRPIPDLHPARAWYEQVQRLIDMNNHIRRPQLAVFSPCIAKVDSWIGVLEGLGRTRRSFFRSRGGREYDIDQEDVLTSVYLFVQEYSQTLAKLGLSPTKAPLGAIPGQIVAVLHQTIEDCREHVQRLARDVHNTEDELVAGLVKIERAQEVFDEVSEENSELKQVMVDNHGLLLGVSILEWGWIGLFRFSGRLYYWGTHSMVKFTKEMDSLSAQWKAHEEQKLQLRDARVNLHKAMTNLGMYY